MAYLSQPSFHSNPSQITGSNFGQTEHLALPTPYAQQHQVSPVLPITSQCYRYEIDRRGSENNSNNGNGNNGQGQGQGQGLQPFPLIMQLHQNAQTSQVNRVPKPWWLWAVAVYEIVEVVVVAVTMVYTVADKGVPANTDREKLMFLFFITLVTLLIQLTGGLALFYGLLTPQERTTISCLQGWIYGSYFLLFQQTIVVLNNILKYGSSATAGVVIETDPNADDPPEMTEPPIPDAGLDVKDDLEKWGAIIGNIVAIVVRIFAVLTMRRFLRNMKVRLIYGIAEGEQPQQRRIGEVPIQRQQDPSNPGEGVLPLQDENLYYAPQLSHVMTMMLS